MVKVSYPPSEKTLQRIEEIRRLRENGIPLKKIAKKFGVHYTWISALNKWDREQRIAQSK